MERGAAKALAAAALLAGLCLIVVLALPSGETQPSLRQPSDGPNIVFILTDDLDVASARKIPGLDALLADEGKTFENAFVTQSLCCPSRATMLTGQYPHNHLVRGNNPPLGGFRTFRELGREESTIATWLDDAGYQTAFFGKYLNGYGHRKEDRTYVPPGWDEWYGEVEYATLNHNGQVVEYPADTYHDDALSGLAQGFIRRQEGKDEPFFMHLSVSAPHAPADPALRYEEFFEDVKVPRTPSFDEADVSDKPEWARIPALNAREKRHIDELYRNRLRTMIPVVETIEGLISTLEETGQLDDTYLVFASDNGYHMGQHRLELGKATAYEEDIRIPLMVLGSGVPEGTTEDAVVLNNDFAPTFADLAGVKPPGSVDGRSFAPLLDGDRDNDPSRWRTAFEVGNWKAGDLDEPINAAVTPVPPYRAVRTPNYLYVEYETGERELYNLNADPHQLESLHDSADPALIEKLGSRLEALRDCEGQGCRDAEN